MTVVLVEGFDHYGSTAQLLVKGWVSGNGGVTSLVTGRFGGQAARCNNFASTGYKILPSTYTTLYAGFAFRPNTLTNPNGYNWALGSGSNFAVRLVYSASGQLTFLNPAGTQMGGGYQLATGVWAYVQVKVVVSASVGSLEVRIDGNPNPFINVSSQNTGSTAIDRVFIGQSSNSTNCDLDDMWIDTAAFLGECRVETLYPNGDGTTSQLVGSDGNSTNNSLLVDESPGPNDDTDYVESSTVGDKDTYAMTNLTTTAGTVRAVQPVPYARKTDAGVRSIVSVARLSGTEEDSADKLLSASYQFLPDIRETKPGGGAWTISDVNSAEFGVKVTA